MKHEFILDGLNCAHCAAKIEQKIADTPGYKNVSFSFATKALSLECEEADIRSQLQELVDSIEDGVTVKPAGDEVGEDDEDGEEISKLRLVTLIAAAILFAAAFALRFVEGTELYTAILSIAAVILSGYDVIIDGVKSALKLRLDEAVLMTVAVAAAVALGDYIEAAAVTVLFAIGEILEDMAVERSRRDIRKLADIRPDTAVIYDNGRTYEADASKVAIGTMLELPPHVRVPLDSVIVTGSGTVDASSLTGESAPVSVKKGDELLSGMMNGDSSMLIRSVREYKDSAATRIVRLVEESAKNKGGGEKLITRFARIYTPAVVLLGVLIAVIPSLITGEWSLWLRRALVCLVASCPCSIVISVPLAYFAGIGAASKIGVLIKGGKYIEALAEAKSFCFDKTGTLTDNSIAVSEIVPVSDYSVEEILTLAASAEAHSAHPAAAAVRAYADSQNISIRELSEYTEIPSYGVKARDDEDTVTVGRPESADGISVKLNDNTIGYIRLSESVRPEAQSAVKALSELGIVDIVMLSGDREEACKRVSDTVGITKHYSSLLPAEKVRKVEELIETDGSCVFVGDGINDAPVLSRSTCGIAMGLGSDAAVESADAVLSSGTLSPLPGAVKLARSTLSTVKANIAFSLLVKAAVITLAALGFAPLWLAVLSDTGVCLLCVLNSVRLISRGNKTDK